jgi:glycosyltransferase involved in cell wall biosynthesis
MRFAGNSNWNPVAERYLTVDDGVGQMYDCDLWIIVSDRLSAPMLPIRPYLLMVYDYVQRYNSELPIEDGSFLAAARGATRVLVTTRFAEQDALVYAGVPKEKVSPVPMLVPEMAPEQRAASPAGKPYFLWPTNLGSHKNQSNAVTALRDYYELLDGQLDCRVSGVNSESLLKSDLPYLQPLALLVSESKALRRRLRILGEIPDVQYGRQLFGAEFLWHPARIDNGSFTVVEAALLGVPSLSSRYPAMEEMEARFNLHLTWMDAQRPDDMALRLKWMEENAALMRARLPSRQDLSQHSVERLAGDYWTVVRECL